MKNAIYKQYADYIFPYFKDCLPNQGLYLFRTLSATARKEKKSQSEILIYTIVIYNLIENNYLSTEDQHFVKLTEKGYYYMQGDDLNVEVVRLEDYVEISDIDRTFNSLWNIIGKENIAPFYVKGSTYFDVIKPYTDETSVSYTDYIAKLKQLGLSQSRVIWYKELLKKVKKEDISYFLNELSNGILNDYTEESVCDGLVTPVNSSVFLENDETIFSDTKNTYILEKKIFITYSWEDDNHNAWVHKLGSDLEKAGFNIVIDIEQPLGTELSKFMEDTISSSDKVLIIATPKYKERADNRHKGVGYETSLITADLIKDQNRIKFIPIIRSGSIAECYPVYLGTIKGLSMTDSDDYNKKLEELIGNLKNY